MTTKSTILVRAFINSYKRHVNEQNKSNADQIQPSVSGFVYFVIENAKKAFSKCKDIENEIIVKKDFAIEENLLACKTDGHGGGVFFQEVKLFSSL